MSSQINRLYTFGLFRLAPDERLLWRDDDCIHLTPKAFDLLVALVESAGHLVCRSDLIEQLWANSVVEEHSLTWNVSALRRALNDDGETPRYIETVRGHGYRFIAPVQISEHRVPEPVAEPSGAAPANVSSADAPALSARLDATATPTPGTSPEPAMEPTPIRQRLSRGALIAALVAVMVLAGAAAYSFYFYFFRHPTPVSAQSRIVRPTVAVVEFRNLSHDHDHDLDWIGDALTEMLGTELATGDKVNVTPAADVARVLRRNDADNPAAALTPTQLANLSKSLGADATLVGAYLSQGKGENQRIRVDLRVLQHTQAGKGTTWTVSATGSDLFELVTKLGRQLRGRLGLDDLNPAQKSEFVASMPATSDAAADYASGLAALASGNALLARTLLSRTVQQQPDFPLAHSALARAWLDLGDNRKASDEAEIALRHSAGLSYTQRQLLLGLKAEADHQWGQATAAYRKLFDANPDSLNYGLMLARTQEKAGDYDQAKATLAQLQKLPAPFGNDPRVLLVGVDVHVDLGENQAGYDSAMQAARQALQLGEDALQATALSAAANAQNKMDHFSEAFVLARKAKALFAANDDGHLDAGINFQRLGMAHDGMGQYDQALAAYEDANQLFAGIGNRYWQAVSLNNMAGVYFRRDQLDQARSYYDRALPIFRELHRDKATAVILNNLAAVVGSQGHLDQAVVYAKQALAVRRTLGAPRSVASTLLNLGLDSFALGQLDAAEKYLQEARDTYLDQHAQSDASDAITGLADLAYARNQLDAARKGYEQALAMRREQKVATSVAWSQRDLAELDLDSGHPQSALKRARTALPVFISAKTPGDIAGTRTDIALALTALGRMADARRETALLDTELMTLHNPRTLLGLNIARATVARRLGDGKHAEQLLLAALQQAQAMKMKSRIYPARLELMRLHVDTQPPGAATRNDIRKLVHDARQDGFLFVADRAQTLLDSHDEVSHAQSEPGKS